MLVVTASIAAVLLLWPWLSLLTSTAYTYLWWLRPEVHWAPTPAAVASNSSLANSAVPKVIHQTWKTTEVPAKWAAARQSCIDLHPDYEHRLWTDEDGLNFISVRRRLTSQAVPAGEVAVCTRLWSVNRRCPINRRSCLRRAWLAARWHACSCHIAVSSAALHAAAVGPRRGSGHRGILRRHTASRCCWYHPPASPSLHTPTPLAQEHYPWFLPTYRSYAYAIQRVDVVRYFLLHHYGGLYLDLDVGCKKRLDFMRAGGGRERGPAAPGTPECGCVRSAPSGFAGCWRW